MVVAVSPFIIRSALPDDAAGLAALVTQLGYPSDERAIRERLATLRRRGEGEVLVAVAAGGALLGKIHVQGVYLLEAEPHALISGLVVDAARRSEGIGDLLVRAAETWARSQGFVEMRLRTNVLRERAHRFYERLGYVEAKVQKQFRKALDAG